MKGNELKLPEFLEISAEITKDRSYSMYNSVTMKDRCEVEVTSTSNGEAEGNGISNGLTNGEVEYNGVSNGYTNGEIDMNGASHGVVNGISKSVIAREFHDEADCHLSSNGCIWTTVAGTSLLEFSSCDVLDAHKKYVIHLIWLGFCTSLEMTRLHAPCLCFGRLVSSCISFVDPSQKVTNCFQSKKEKQCIFANQFLPSLYSQV